MTIEYPTLSQGRYQIERCIGAGGMAAVFKCYDRTLKVHRAIKVLKPEMVTRGTIRERFTTEAVAMANLNHPNTVQVYDHGLEGLTLFIVMEYLPHNSLQQYLEKRGPLSKEQAVSVCLDICRAIQSAHEQGMIHRDIKPDNILLAPRGAKLSDFGLARMQEDERQATRTQAVMGTFPFMAPEQRLSAKKTNHQSDVYALAATLFVMITCEDPRDLFDVDSRVELLMGLDEDLADIIERGCQSSLEKRYPSINEMIRDLEKVYERCDLEKSKLVLNEEVEVSVPKEELKTLLSVWEEYVTNSDGGNNEDSGDTSSETLLFDLKEEEAELISAMQTKISEAPLVSTAPSESEMQKGAPRSNALAIVIGIVLLCLGIGFYVQGSSSKMIPIASQEIPIEVPSEEYLFLEDDRGNIVAVTLDRKSQYPVFAGTKEALYAQRRVGGSRAGTTKWSFGFWDRRFRDGYQREVLMQEEKYWIQCGNTKTMLNPIQLSAQQVKWYDVAWQRSAVALARSLDGTFYYVDSKRQAEGIEAPRLFVGKKGEVVFYEIKDQLLERSEKVFTSDMGSLILQGEKVFWSDSTGKEELSLLNLWEQGILIYQELGAYEGQLLRTACDPYVFRSVDSK